MMTNDPDAHLLCHLEIHFLSVDDAAILYEKLVMRFIHLNVDQR